MLGIILSVFLFTFMTLIFQHYADLEFIDYKTFPKDSLLINRTVLEQEVNELETLLDNFEGIYYNYYRKGIFLIRTTKYDIPLSLYFTKRKDLFHYPIPSATKDNALEVSELLYGRHFSEEDYLLNSRVLIISESASEYLFGKKNSVGETIMVSQDQYEIIGVYKDTISNFRQRKRWSEKESYSIMGFAPMNSNSYDFNVNKIVIRSPYNPESVKEVIEKELSGGNIFTYQGHYEDYLEIKEEIHWTMFIVLLILLAISTLNIVVVLFFSVKERVSEIGIKKAIGASEDNIVLQFTTEALVIGVIGSFIGAILAIIAYIIISLKNSFSYGTLLYDIDYVYLLVNMGVFISAILLFSIIPSIIASRLNILKALRFE